MGLAAACLVSAIWGLHTALASKFGIGCYNDTPWSPPLTSQLPVAANLTGAGGWTLLFFGDLDPTTAAPPKQWQVDALMQAYSLGLRVVVRLGQALRNYRYFSDDAEHLSYTKLAAVWRGFVAQLPLPVDGSNLWVQLGNEPNVCMEWQCTEGAGVFMNYTQVAAESAAFSRDLAAALRSLPRVAASASPIAQVGFASCECVWSGGVGPQDVNGTVFLAAMLAHVPSLFDGVDFLAVHPYPACALPFDAPCAGGWLAAYRDQVALARASRAQPGAPLPVVVGETGWPGGNETGKAAWMVQALAELFLPDAGVVAVLPFLLAGPFWADAGWPWTTWAAATGNTTLAGLQPQYLAVQALARRAEQLS